MKSNFTGGPTISEYLSRDQKRGLWWERLLTIGNCLLVCEGGINGGLFVNYQIWCGLLTLLFFGYKFYTVTNYLQLLGIEGRLTDVIFGLTLGLVCLWDMRRAIICRCQLWGWCECTLEKASHLDERGHFNDSTLLKISEIGLTYFSISFVNFSNLYSSNPLSMPGRILRISVSA